MLEVTNLKYKYPMGHGSFHLDVPYAEFGRNRISSILGLNGSGKTTMLNLIGGHARALSGSVKIDGTEMIDLPARLRPTSTVFQQIGLFPHFTVKQNIALGIEPNTLTRHKPTTLSRVDEILADFSLEEFANRKPSQLSIGQQQRVAIARALASRPSVLLLDEPTSALDFKHIDYLGELLLSICDREFVPIIIIVSHDLHFVLSIADDIKYMEYGKIVFDGNIDQFKNSKLNCYERQTEL